MRGASRPCLRWHVAEETLALGSIYQVFCQELCRDGWVDLLTPASSCIRAEKEDSSPISIQCGRCGYMITLMLYDPSGPLCIRFGLLMIIQSLEIMQSGPVLHQLPELALAHLAWVVYLAPGETRLHCTELALRLCCPTVVTLSL